MLRTHFFKSMSYNFLNSLQPLILLKACVTSVIQTDIEFVAHQVGINGQEVSIETYDKATFLRHQELILQHFGYQAFDEMARAFTIAEIQALVRVQHRPKFIFLEVVQLLTRKKITLPTYNLGLINQKNGLSCDHAEALGISGVQTKYRFQNWRQYC